MESLVSIFELVSLTDNYCGYLAIYIYPSVRTGVEGPPRGVSE